VGSIHPRNGKYVVVLIVIESCVIPVSIFVPKNPVKSFIVTVVWNGTLIVNNVVAPIMKQWMLIIYTVILHNQKLNENKKEELKLKGD